MSSTTGPAVITDEACADLFEVKRFDDIVVGARAQPVDLVLPAIAGGQDQDRVGFALLAYLANDVEPGNLRQPEIDDREVDRVFHRKIQALAAVGGLLDRVTRIGELCRKGFAQGVVVFYDQ